MAAKIRAERHKGVAHHEVIGDGGDWRVWWIGESRLTFPELDAYVQSCTEAIVMLYSVRAVTRPQTHAYGVSMTARRAFYGEL